MAKMKALKKGKKLAATKTLSCSQGVHFTDATVHMVKAEPSGLLQLFGLS
jgi:hypothetical protein